jgi:ankyrin repeat protein
VLLRSFAAALVSIMVMNAATAQDQTERQRCAMLAAASEGDVGAIHRLVTVGAKVNVAEDMGRSPLLLAVQENRLDAFTALLSEGADINQQALNHDTPWLLAGALGRTQMLRLMIPKGPDLTIRNRFGGNALIPACERGHVDTVRLLLAESRIDVNHINNLGWTCLLEIVILGDGGPRFVEITKLVLDAGADPSIADKKGVTPLAHARQRGQTEVARLIAARGGK